MRVIFFIVTIVALFGCESRSKRNSRESLSTIDNQIKHDNFRKGYHKVYKVVDGDTFWVKSENGKEIKIRLIGIDAPETRNVFKKKKHPFGVTSKQYLIDLLAADPYIKLEYDVNLIDQFNRTLAYAYLSNGTFINEKMVKDGYALIMTVSPNVKYEHSFFKAQQYAKTNSLGIWGQKVE